MIPADPVHNPLVRGCLSCLCRFRDSRTFREVHPVWQTIGL